MDEQAALCQYNATSINLNGLTLEKYQEFQSTNSTSGVTHCDRSIASHGCFVVVDLLSMCAVTVWQWQKNLT